MCIGESSGDTLNGVDQDVLSAAKFAAYRLELRANDDGMTWACLTPKSAGDLLPEITICRIDPCVMVMLEDRYARRQFRALTSVEDALAFVHDFVGDTGAPLTQTLH